MKILYITTIGTTMNFFKSLIKELIEEGNVVDIATNTDIADVSKFYKDLNCNIYKISCLRTPFSFKNIKAIKEIKELVNNNHYDIVHCHTPVASICTRLACKKFRKNGLKVMYTAHGFHFYKGAPLLNWIIYYPIEKLCSHWTDVLVTINREDYELACKKMKANRIEYVSGVGIDIEHFKNTVVDIKNKRESIGISNDSYLILSVGELTKRKNHILVIEALKEINDKNIHYVIAGEGPMRNKLEQYINQNGLDNNVHLLGHRADVNELYKCSDLFVFPSKQEGLPVSLIEAIVCGTYVLSSYIRGSMDILKPKNMFSNKDELISKILDLNSLEIGEYSIDDYSSAKINKIMKAIYFSVVKRK